MKTDLVICFSTREIALNAARNINKDCGTDFEMMLIDLEEAEDMGLEIEVIPPQPRAS